jgi:hypothetical protein
MAVVSKGRIDDKLNIPASLFQRIGNAPGKFKVFLPLV